MTAADWANVILVVHFAYAALVVLPVPYVLLGWSRDWPLTRTTWFRTAHLVLIAPVVAEIILGQGCPLTVLGNHLRRLAGQPVYGVGCVDFWVGRFLGHALSAGLLSALNSLLVFSVPVLYLALPPCWLAERRARRRAASPPRHAHGQ